MTTTCKGIIKGDLIGLDSELPYPEGTEVAVQVKPILQELPEPTEEGRRRFWATVGIGASRMPDKEIHRRDAESGAENTEKR